MMIKLLLTIACMVSMSIPAHAFWFGGGSGGAGVPGGTNTQVQYHNEAGTFSGHAGLTYNPTAAKLTVGYQSSGTGFTGLQNNGGGSWTKSRILTVTAPAQALPAGYSVKVALTGAAALAVFNTGAVNSIRVYSTAVTAVELDRYVESFTNASVIIWFKLRNQIAIAQSDATYVLYYENDLAGAAPATINNIFTKDYGETGLLALWHMDEGVGFTTADSSGSGRTGTLVGTPVWQGTDGGQWDGQNIQFETGSHLQFDGTNYVTFSDTGLPSNSANRTVTFWMRPTQAQLDWSMIVWMGTRNFNQQWIVTVDSGNNIALSNYGQAVFSSGVNVCDGNKHFVRVSNEGNSYSIYIDEVLRGTGAMTTSIALSGTGYMGKHPSENGYKGFLDELRIYNRLLSVDEANARFKRRLWVSSDTVAIDGDFAAEGSEQVAGATIGGMRTLGIPTYADNATATAGGLEVGDEYQTAAGVQRRVY